MDLPYPIAKRSRIADINGRRRPTLLLAAPIQPSHVQFNVTLPSSHSYKHQMKCPTSCSIADVVAFSMLPQLCFSAIPTIAGL
jgi:hypothetical protein